MTDTKSRKRKRSLGSFINRPITAIILLIIALALIVSVVFYFKRVASYSVEEHVYHFQYGTKFDYTGTTKIEQQEEGPVLINEEKSVPLTGSPLYMTEGNSIVTIEHMEYVDLRGSTDPLVQSKLNYFSRIDANEDQSLRVTSGRKTKDIVGGVLFNGQGTYVLLEEGSISIDGKEMDLPVLTTLCIERGQYVEIFTPTSEKEMVIPATEEVNIVLASGAAVNMNRDVVQLVDGTSFYLITNINNLKEFM